MSQTLPVVGSSTANGHQEEPKKKRGRPPAGPATCATCARVFPLPSKMRSITRFSKSTILRCIWLTLNRKHAKKHDPDIPCQAHGSGTVTCHEMFPDNKEMIRHLWAYHEDYAKDPLNHVPDIRKTCSICGDKIKRGDNTKRHMKEVHGGEKRRSSREKMICAV